MGTFLKRSNTAKLHYSEDELLQLFSEEKEKEEESENKDEKRVTLSKEQAEEIMTRFIKKIQSIKSSDFSNIQTNPQLLSKKLSGILPVLKTSQIRELIIRIGG